MNHSSFVQQWPKLFSHILVCFPDKAVLPGYWLDCLDLVHPAETGRKEKGKNLWRVILYINIGQIPSIRVVQKTKLLSKEMADISVSSVFSGLKYFQKWLDQFSNFLLLEN